MQQSPLFTPCPSENIFNRPGITKLTSVLKKDERPYPSDRFERSDGYVHPTLKVDN